MIHPRTNPAARNLPTSRVNDVPTRIAMSLLGQAVSLLVDAKTITHGVVTGVLTDAEAPKIVVRGMRYDLGQILTTAPVAFGA